MKVAIFAPPYAHDSYQSIKKEVNRVFGKKMELEIPFFWEPPTVSQMRATGVCDELDETCWKESEKAFYCDANITTFIQKITGYNNFLFLTPHCHRLRATPQGLQTGSAVGICEGKKVSVVPFWDMGHVLHELGHMLGLDHCKDEGCIMFGGYIWIKKETLCRDCQEALQKLNL
jgi:hypothetical protein